MPGGRIVVCSWVGTAVFLVVAALAVTVEALAAVAVLADLTLFGAGSVVFLWAYGMAIARSRTDAIGIGGLYFLAGEVAPARVRRHLMASFAVEVVAALVAASLRPFTSVAFAILVPVYGLGMAGLWGARHGRFAPRQGIGPSN